MSLRALPADTSSDLTSSVIGTLTAVVGSATVEDVVLEPAAPVVPDVPVVPDGAEHAAQGQRPGRHGSHGPPSIRHPALPSSSIHPATPAGLRPRCWLPETLL